MIAVNGIGFKTKKQLMEYFHTKRENFSSSDPFWCELIKRHPEYEEKIGSGFLRIDLRPNPFKKHLMNHFVIVRTDGSEVDISMNACVNGMPKNNNQDLISALRFSIKDQINNFKTNSELKCSLCGAENIEMHVDHFNPKFKDIVKEFLEKINSYNIPREFDSDEKYCSSKFKNKDAMFELQFATYHNDNAILRILCFICNNKKENK